MPDFLERRVKIRLLSLNSNNLLSTVTIPSGTGHAIEFDSVSDARAVRLRLSLDEGVTCLDDAKRNCYGDRGGGGTNILDVFHFVILYS